MVDITIAILLYPGLALAIAIALLFGWLIYGRIRLGRVRGISRWASMDGLAGLTSIMLAALALALLPWPLHPAPRWSWVGMPLALWAALEGAFLVPLLPGLLAPSPLAARAAAREAQIGIAGRFVIWLALGTALWAGAGWTQLELPGRVLAGLAGLLALPAATGIAPFDAERSLSMAGAETGLDEMTAGLLRFARTLRGAVVLAALVVGSLPPVQPWAAQPLVQPPIGLALIAALFVLIALGMRRAGLTQPRVTLPAALRWCWWRALPLAVVGLVYLIVV